MLGEKSIPADAYDGVPTARGLENFHVSGVPLRHYPDFIKALTILKLAAARANPDRSQLSQEILAPPRAPEEADDAELQRLFDQY